MGGLRAISPLVVAVTVAACSGPAATSVQGPEPVVGGAVRLHGEVGARGLSLAINGRPMLVPDAQLRAEVRKEFSVSATEGGPLALAPPPEGGYPSGVIRWLPSADMPPPLEVAGWQLAIFQIGRNGEAIPFYSVMERGAPKPVSWNGKSSEGKSIEVGAVYVAQLYVVGNDREAAAASAFLPFAVAVPAVGRPSEHVLNGELFGSGAKPNPAPALRNKVDEIAKEVGPGWKVDVQVHSDGSPDQAVATWAKTVREAKAVAALLAAAGVPADAITAKGVGSSSPLLPPITPENRAKNQRVVIAVTPPSAGPSAPAIASDRLPTTYAMVQIDGRTVELRNGAFEEKRFRSDTGGFLVHMEATDGRMAMITTGSAMGRPRSPSAPIGPGGGPEGPGGPVDPSRPHAPRGPQAPNGSTDPGGSTASRLPR